MDGELYHYGTPRHSGRYPWGSGEDPYQEDSSLLGRAAALKKNGLTEVEIAESLGMTTSELRARKSIEKDERRSADISRARILKDKGMSNVAIGKAMGKNESSIRSLLNSDIETRTKQTQATVDVLKEEVKNKKYIDVGKGTNIGMGISPERLKTAVQALKDEGYVVNTIKVEQATIPGQYTTVKVLSSPGATWKEVIENKDSIGVVNKKFEDQFSTSVLGLKPIQSLSSKRVGIAYNSDKDGVIELRPGVNGLSLGDSRYAQVRIGVDGTRYLKGMAVYSNDLPDGIDIRFNTNKDPSVPKKEVLKSMKTTSDGSIDKDNPFGATIKPGGQRGYLNIVSEEGDWLNWDKSLSSQMLSKQSVSLAKRQLNIEYENKKAEYDQIKSLTNPTIKKFLLESFGDDLDSSASHLKAAALPRQAYHVILPVRSLKSDEIYAPNYKNGERVVLIRYPHGGTFEIPELTVNNNNREAKRTFHNALDAVGIPPVVANRLSGADFDGDTVLVIPNNNRSVKTTPALKGLQNFDPKTAYPGYDGMKKMSNTQTEMGKISNLITDMTVKNASSDEIARAVRHSMVIIDAEKHGLNYKQSYLDNNISELKNKYQSSEGSSKRGASTLISRSDAKVRVPERKMYAPIDPKTGQRIYSKTGSTYTNKYGKTVERTTNSTNMRETNDAYSLSSGTAIESAYAEYANKLKAMANSARKDMVNTKDISYSPSARRTYSKEVQSLDAKLKAAQMNAPLERKAQLVASQIISAKKRDNPEMDADRLKKVKAQSLAEARVRTGAGKKLIKVTPSEWEAIQAGAISKTQLQQIFLNSDQEHLKSMAMPRSKETISEKMASQIKARIAAGYTQSEVAESLGISVSTVRSVL